MTAGQGTPRITETELGDELARRGLIGYPPGAYEAAHQMFRGVLEHREPEYEPGAQVEDADGNPYIRSTGGCWVAYSGARVGDEVPKRPLHPMARQGAAEKKLARITAFCEGWLSGDPCCPEVASAVLASIGVEEESRG